MWFLLLLIIISSVYCVLWCIKIYQKFHTPASRCFTCMVRKTVVVTGANQGMGYWVALDFAMRGAHVIMVCRKKDKAEEARQSIIKASGNNDVMVKIVNLCSFKSIRAFAYETLKTETRLDILVNNAGIMRPNGLTEDGYHPTLQANALGPFLLTMLLLDLLTSTLNSRVINVTTMSGIQYRNLYDNFVDKHDNCFSYANNYENSKKVQTLLMRELAYRLMGSKTSVHFSIPRYSNTKVQLYENMPDVMLFMKKHILFPYIYRTPEDSCQNTIYAAISPDVSGIGKFYRDCKELKLQQEAGVDLSELRKFTWAKCIRMVKLGNHEIRV